MALAGDRRGADCPADGLASDSPRGWGRRAWPSTISRRSLAVNLIRRPFKWNGTCLRYARVRSAHSVISVRPRLRRISAAWAGVNNCGMSSAARSTAVKASTPHGNGRHGRCPGQPGCPRARTGWSPQDLLVILFKLDLLTLSTLRVRAASDASVETQAGVLHSRLHVAPYAQASPQQAYCSEVPVV